MQWTRFHSHIFYLSTWLFIIFCHSDGEGIAMAWRLTLANVLFTLRWCLTKAGTLGRVGCHQLPSPLPPPTHTHKHTPPLPNHTQTDTHIHTCLGLWNMDFHFEWMQRHRRSTGNYNKTAENLEFYRCCTVPVSEFHAKLCSFPMIFKSINRKVIRLNCLDRPD